MKKILTEIQFGNYCSLTLFIFLNNMNSKILTNLVIFFHFFIFYKKKECEMFSIINASYFLRNILLQDTKCAENNYYTKFDYFSPILRKNIKLPYNLVNCWNWNFLKSHCLSWSEPIRSYCKMYQFLDSNHLLNTLG